MVRGLKDCPACPRCENTIESHLHLLRDCSTSKAIWSRWFHGQHFERFCALPFRDWMKFNLSRKNVLVEDGIPWPIYFSFVCWIIWKFRNKCVFETGFHWHVNMQAIILRSMFNFMRYK
ncbi:hypothetical protein REPUB_Repub15cG0030300 [Reevesia pubescens]